MLQGVTKPQNENDSMANAAPIVTRASKSEPMQLKFHGLRSQPCVSCSGWHSWHTERLPNQFEDIINLLNDLTVLGAKCHLEVSLAMIFSAAAAKMQL